MGEFVRAEGTKREKALYYNVSVGCFLSVTYRKFVFSQFQDEAFVTILTPVKKSIKSGKLLASGHTYMYAFLVSPSKYVKTGPFLSHTDELIG